jgi:hypothetical protein
LYCCSTFQCHSRDYNNEQNSFPTKSTENGFFFFIICYEITIYANERQSEIERERERDVHKLMNKYICLKVTSKISRKKEKKTD